MSQKDLCKKALAGLLGGMVAVAAPLTATDIQIARGGCASQSQGYYYQSNQDPYSQGFDNQSYYQGGTYYHGATVDNEVHEAPWMRNDTPVYTQSNQTDMRNNNTTNSTSYNPTPQQQQSMMLTDPNSNATSTQNTMQNSNANMMQNSNANMNNQSPDAARDRRYPNGNFEYTPMNPVTPPTAKDAYLERQKQESFYTPREQDGTTQQAWDQQQQYQNQNYGPQQSYEYAPSYEHSGCNTSWHGY